MNNKGTTQGCEKSPEKAVNDRCSALPPMESDHAAKAAPLRAGLQQELLPLQMEML